MNEDAQKAAAAAEDLERARSRLLEASKFDEALFAQYRDLLGYTPRGYVDTYSPQGQMIGRRRQNLWDRCSNRERTAIMAAVAVAMIAAAFWSPSWLN